MCECQGLPWLHGQAVEINFYQRPNISGFCFHLEIRFTAPLAVLGGKNSREKNLASAWILSLILSISRLYLYVGKTCGVGGLDSRSGADPADDVDCACTELLTSDSVGILWCADQDLNGEQEFI